MGEEKYPNFSLEKYLKENGISFVEHDSEDHVEFAMNCPKCVDRGEKRPDTKHRLWINKRDGHFYCYNCAWAGRILHLVRALSHCNLQKAITILKGDLISSFDILNFPLVHEEYEFDEDEEIPLREVELPHGFIAFGEEKKKTIYHKYIHRRGISTKQAKNQMWGYCRVGYLKHRIVVPTFINDRLVFWQARDILENKHPLFGTKDYKKVLNPRGVSARKVLYNYDNAKNCSTIILTEGFMDVEKVGAQAVATNGKVLHSAQHYLLSKTKAKKVIIMYDPDAFTDYKRKEKCCSAQVAANTLASSFDVGFCRLPEGRDAGSYEVGELAEYIESHTTTSL